MTDKLEKLTKQIYEEGVEKARQEAEKIIESANQEKDKILRSASKDAESIKAKAQKESNELKKKVESELRMASQQSLTMLKQKITELICSDVAKASSQGILDDTKFLQKSIEIILKSWAESGCSDQDIFLKLPKSVKKDMEEFFANKAKQNLDKGLSVTFDEGIKSGFTISPKDGTYRIGFSDDDFQSFVQSFLRPQMKQFLFAAQKDE